MPLLRMHTGAYKAIHPAKAVGGVLPPNADMMAHCDHYMLCLDGVSGVPPPMKAEDLSWDLRNVLQWNLMCGTHHNQVTLTVASYTWAFRQV